VAEQTMTYEQKVKSYMKVFYILIALTVVELIFVELPKMYPSIPHKPMVILICAASLAKAVYVAYYFMHLNHETPWLRKLIFLALICFFYAAVLIPDTIWDRPMVKYLPEPARVFKTEAHHGADAKGHETSATKAAGETKANAATPDTSATQAPAAAGAEAPGNTEEAQWE